MHDEYRLALELIDNIRPWCEKLKDEYNSTTEKANTWSKEHDREQTY